MKIATYNVNGISARLPVLLRWLEETSPDVACLQELKAPEEKFPLLAINAAGYNAVWHGQKSWNGVAVLAKNGLELEESGRGLAGDPTDEQSRFIEAHVDGIRVCCLYLPNGNPAPGPKFDYKMGWMERLLTRANALVNADEPVVMLGDYNVIPTDLDAQRPERWIKDAVFSPEAKEAYQRLLAQGWTDSIRELYPDQKIFTYWDYFRNAFARDAGIRMDHILLNPVAAPRLKEGAVDRNVRGWEKTSDHAPVWITIN
ncbi:MAG: exodeoxyribonuclease III [Candidatus Melainabacteria bacterium]|nr:MAG: exodeoxyribonuclease III [Candidatus Melainabacteria bacterium]